MDAENGNNSADCSHMDYCKHRKIGTCCSGHNHNRHYFYVGVRVALLLVTVGALSCLLLYHNAYPLEFLPNSTYRHNNFTYALSLEANMSSEEKEEKELERVLRKASMVGKTVILTTLNEAWAAPGSLFDLFLESFKIGSETIGLVDHLVVVAVDRKAYNRCLEIHPNCYQLKTDGVDFSGEKWYMSTDYLKMMWRRLDFLHTVLTLGYSFVFTDADIMWLRNPFPHFFPDADFQIACDRFWGDPKNLANLPNGGYIYAKSNNRTIQFYKFWNDSRITYLGKNEQDVLNIIKFSQFVRDLGLQIRFLDTVFFGGFCEASRDFSLVCTMHANCCAGLDNKIHDLKILLDDWRRYKGLSADKKISHPPTWSVPQKCGPKSFHPQPKKQG